MHYLDAISQISDLTRSTTVADIGNDTYNFTFILLNDKNYISLNNSAIRNLVIQDNFLSWYREGSAVIENSLFYLDNSKQPFEFSGGGRDFLFIDISPKVSDLGVLSRTDVSIRNLFSVYDYSDNTSEDNSANTKTISFRDFIYDNLNNFNSEWSTTDGVRRLYPEFANIPTSQLSDNDRSLYTGDAIKDFLTIASGSKSSFQIDPGMNKTFYCPPVGSSGVDTLEYLLDQHIHSDDGQPCVLRHHTSGSTDSVWTLFRLSDYFELATADVSDKNGDPTKMTGVLSDERFTVSTTAGDTVVDDTDVVIMTPVDSPITLRVPGKDTITSFTLSKPSIDEQTQYLSTSPVHTYKRSTGVFNVYCRDNSTRSYNQFLQSKFINKMHTKDGGSRVNTASMGYIDSVYASDDDPGVFTGRNRSLLSEVLFANTVQFSLPGHTLRTSSKFVTLDAPAGARTNTPLGKTLYGQWLITDLKHIFTRESYTNSFLASKPYKYTA